ncbi:MAG: hypothetical protein IPJ15_01115 [Actinomycetales bacterium]|jgi:hypothetical protein|nr:hypothetical protein [Candidatus Phosphoribacter baldrii]
MNRALSTRNISAAILFAFISLIGPPQVAFAVQDAVTQASTASYVAVLGDSIASGSFRSSPGSISPTFVGPGWASRLASVGPASVEYADLTRGGSYLALDNTGAGIPAISTTFTPMVSSLPNCVAAFVAAGRNDLYHATDQVLKDAVNSIVRQATALGIDLAFETIQPVSAAYHSYGLTEPQRTRFNTWLKVAHPDHVLDADVILDADRNGQLDSAFDSGDGFHLNSEGSARMASAASALVARNRWALPSIRGSLDSLTPDPGSIHVTGWALDESQPSRQPTMSATLDGAPSRIGGVHVSRPDVPRYVNNEASGNLGFSMWIAADPGWHILCTYASLSTGGPILLARGCRQIYLPPVEATPAPPECPAMTNWRRLGNVWSMSLWCQGKEFVIGDVRAAGQVSIVLPDGRPAWVDAQLDPAIGTPQMSLYVSTARSFWLRMDVVGTTPAGRWATFAESWNAPGHHMWVNGQLVF